MRPLFPFLFLLITSHLHAEDEPLEQQVTIALKKLTSGSLDNRKEGELLLLQAGKKEAREVARLVLLNSSTSNDPELLMRVPGVLKDLFRLSVLTSKEALLGVSWRWYVEAIKDESIHSWPMVEALEEDGLLAKAGVRKHDIIRSINGKTLSSLESVAECQRLFGLVEKGKEIVLIVTGSKVGKKHLVKLEKNRTIKFKSGARKSAVREERAGEYDKWLTEIKEELEKP